MVVFRHSIEFQCFSGHSIDLQQDRTESVNDAETSNAAVIISCHCDVSHQRKNIRYRYFNHVLHIHIIQNIRVDTTKHCKTYGADVLGPWP